MNENTLPKALTFFKALADENRLKIIALLLEEEKCVCDISVDIDMSQPAVSYQLKILREANLVSTRKEKQRVFYFLSDEHVKEIVRTTIVHLEHE